MNKVSIILSSYKRPHLLRLGLSSILRFKPTINYEIIVLNDGVYDETEEICNKYKDVLPIKYMFTGQRNLGDIVKSRVPGFAYNIGIKQAEGDIIILSSPEVYHLNSAVDILYENILKNPNCMVIPEFIYFDQANIVTIELTHASDDILLTKNINLNQLVSGVFGHGHVVMPYLMAIYKQNILDIGGYDEDFIGYAGEDCDLVNRLKLKGLTHLRTAARAVHLWHPGTGDGGAHWENPDWVYNYNLLNDRKGILVRNEGKEWGVLDE